MLHFPKDSFSFCKWLSYWKKCNLDMGQHPKCKLALKEAVQWTGFSGFLRGNDWPTCERSYGEQTILSDHLIPILSYGILSAAQEFVQCQTNAIRSKQLMINLFPDQFWSESSSGDQRTNFKQTHFSPISPKKAAFSLGLLSVTGVPTHEYGCSFEPMWPVRCPDSHP